MSALNDETGDYAEGRGGLFAISLDDGRIRKLSTTVYWQIAALGQPDVWLLASTGDGIVSVGRDGRESRISDIDGRISISPSREWAAIIGEKATELYHLTTGESTPLPTGVDSVVWAPLEVGVVLVAPRRLQYFSFATRRLSVLDTCEDERCGFRESDLGWAK